jgi:hypothetical protein
MEDAMGFERHAIPSTETRVTKSEGSALREAAPVVMPLRREKSSHAADVVRLARQLRSEWRSERYSRLAGG